VGAIELDGVEKVYGGGVHAVRGLDLTISEAELLVLLGPSGCGKTTVLRLVAGLESLTEGEIRVAGRRVDQMPPSKRDVAMIFQSYALYPHMTVRKNLAFPLRMRGASKDERARRIEHVTGLLSLEPLLDKLPGELSGGQQQRVAIGRALVREPAAFLMDEPLSNLDAQLRSRIRADLAELQRRLAITTLFVTHDQTEAMTLGDRVAVMREGCLQQVGTPDELYRSPTNVFVAWFVGSPSMNLVRGRAAEGVGTPTVTLVGDTEASFRAPSMQTGEGDVIVGWRPEDLALGAPEGDRPLLNGSVSRVESLGSERLVYVQTGLTTTSPEGEDGSGTLVVRTPTSGPVPRPGENVSLLVREGSEHVFGADGVSLAATFHPRRSGPAAGT